MAFTAPNQLSTVQSILFRAALRFNREINQFHNNNLQFVIIDNYRIYKQPLIRLIKHYLPSLAEEQFNDEGLFFSEFSKFVRNRKNLNQLTGRLLLRDSLIKDLLNLNQLEESKQLSALEQTVTRQILQDTIEKTSTSEKLVHQPNQTIFSPPQLGVNPTSAAPPTPPLSQNRAKGSLHQSTPTQDQPKTPNRILENNPPAINNSPPRPILFLTEQPAKLVNNFLRPLTLLVKKTEIPYPIKNTAKNLTSFASIKIKSVIQRHRLPFYSGLASGVVGFSVSGFNPIIGLGAGLAGGFIVPEVIKKISAAESAASTASTKQPPPSQNTSTVLSPSIVTNPSWPRSNLSSLPPVRSYQFPGYRPSFSTSFKRVFTSGRSSPFPSSGFYSIKNRSTVVKLALPLLLFFIGGFLFLSFLPGNDTPSTEASLADKITLVKSGPTAVANESTFEYSIKVTYQGRGKADIQVSDTLPSTLNYLSSNELGQLQPGPAGTGQTVVWTIKELPAATTKQLILRVESLSQANNSYVTNKAQATITQVIGIHTSSPVGICQFTRANKSSFINSAKLQSYFEEVAVKSGISAAILASVAMHETQDFVVNAKDNHDAFSGGIKADPRGGNTCRYLTTSVDGALGLMQVIPPTSVLSWANPAANDKNGVSKGAQWAGKSFDSLTVEDYCDIKTNIYLAAGVIFSKNGDKIPTTAEEIEKAVCRYYGGTCFYQGGFNYGAEAARDFLACQAAATATRPTPPSPPTSDIAQAIQNKFGIVMQGFNDQQLKWGWEKFWEISNTNFSSYVTGKAVIRHSDPNTEFSSFTGNCTPTESNPNVYLKPSDEKIFKHILIHELGHIMLGCNTPEVVGQAEHQQALQKEGSVSIYADNPQACVSGTAYRINEDYAETVSYYLVPEYTDQLCGGGSVKPLQTNYPMHYNLMKRLLEKGD